MSASWSTCSSSVAESTSPMQAGKGEFVRQPSSHTSPQHVLCSRSRKPPTEELANESRSTHITVAADMVFSLSHYLSGVSRYEHMRCSFADALPRPRLSTSFVRCAMSLGKRSNPPAPPSIRGYSACRSWSRSRTTT